MSEILTWWQSSTVELVRAAIFSLVDILVVAYVVYRVLLLIRGTRAQQILVGLGLILVAFFGAKMFELRTLSWIMDTFMSSFLLLVIVVFQHDIRRVLSRVGKGPVFGKVSYGYGAFLVEEITRACVAMASQRIGALILIERGGDLEELGESGVRMEARLTGALLQQVFTPQGPLHDGAVLVQQGRITAARVVLPLSQNPHLDQNLGTRHQAAIGATEEYDSVAIVVSEERGRISLAEGGVLTRDLDGATLRQVLYHYFGKQQR